MSKYKILMIGLVILMFLILSKVYAISLSAPLMGKIIYLDAGHGGVDSGATYGKILEKDINLILVKKIEKELVSRGAIVYLTRDGDYDLADTTNGRKRSDLGNRAWLINKSNCDMYISIHLNYIGNSKWQGLQIFYNNKNKLNEEMARMMTEYLKVNMSNVRDYKYANNYYMYRLISKPGILIEMGFLSNPNDRYRLTREEYQDKIVKKIVEAIDNYFRVV